MRHLTVDHFPLSPHPAPEVAPGNIMAVAEDTSSISLSWSPPPAHLQNGVRRNYIIHYHPTFDPAVVSVLNVGADASSTRLTDLTPGTEYNITMAAVTVAFGPFSEGVVQRTYPLDLPTLPAPQIIPGFDTTGSTSLAVSLPLVDTGAFR